MDRYSSKSWFIAFLILSISIGLGQSELNMNRDVFISIPLESQVLQYDTLTSRWLNANLDSILYSIYSDTSQYSIYADSAGKPDSIMINQWIVWDTLGAYLDTTNLVDSSIVAGWGFCCTDSQQIVDWGFGSASLDTLSAYYDTTQMDSILLGYWDTTIQFNYFTQDSIAWDTLASYYDTTNHFSNFSQDSIAWDTLGAYLDTTISYYTRAKVDSLVGAKCDTPCASGGGTIDSFYFQQSTSWTATGWLQGGATISVDTTSGGGSGITVKDTTLNLKIADFVGSASQQIFSVACIADYVFLSDFWLSCDTLEGLLAISYLRVAADSLVYSTGYLPNGVYYFPTNPYAGNAYCRSKIMKNASVGANKIVINKTTTNFVNKFFYFGEGDADSFYYVTASVDKTLDTLTLSANLIAQKDSGQYLYYLNSTLYLSTPFNPTISIFPNNNKIYFGIIGGTAGAHYRNVNIRMRARMFR